MDPGSPVVASQHDGRLACMPGLDDGPAKTDGHPLTRKDHRKTRQKEQDRLVCEAGAAFTPCNPDAVSARTAATLNNPADGAIPVPSVARPMTASPDFSERDPTRVCQVGRRSRAKTSSQPHSPVCINNAVRMEEGHPSKVDRKQSAY
ncbi:hypothetical protein WOLCODRAFT_151969 [Wolfiporia cocos MD-104 SS10]|uniref:Uncharacterized protein n=1 Tax=Wolfiporia cocos (strain MD-104) TaxID=742152 RepID=A0A2H3JYW5_WOLCO|nr:hypothetical protein WOLCODRAFT_151969 [Wolfiporia cocos MD-104 SS10]